VRYSHTVRFAVTAVLFGAEYGKREQDLAALTRPCSFSWLFIYSPFFARIVKKICPKTENIV
ncbi:MAG: hypothetical protein IKQ04_01490, partial [Oscillospiraceae bacterium]|nr:hypothetical protein [Oscillospiraceae bacterium]